MSVCTQGRLRDHIQNPNAEELLHFLFAPLRLVGGPGLAPPLPSFSSVPAGDLPPQVIQAGGVALARSVVVPLLTRDAIDFLHGSGTPEERHLWVTLGDGWTKCR